MICKEYLGIGDGFALNLFRLCLYIKTGFSHKNPSAQASQRGGRAGSPNEGACHEVRAQQKTSILNPNNKPQIPNNQSFIVNHSPLITKNRLPFRKKLLYIPKTRKKPLPDSLNPQKTPIKGTPPWLVLPLKIVLILSPIALTL